MTTSPFQIYIGYDKREEKAFDVCKYSIQQHHTPWYPDVEIHKLYSKDIPEYNRNWGEPQSTDFTFTRFWVPYLSGYKGVSMFCDCDFLFLEDPQELIYKHFDEKYAIQVVKHPAYIPNSELKMDGVPQHRAYRKNWASLILFNNEHPQNKLFGPELLNGHKPGLDFHQFSFYDDDQIGSLPLEWNCLDDYYHLDDPKAIHYTDGGPWFDNYKDTMYSDLWTEMYLRMKNESKES